MDLSAELPNCSAFICKDLRLGKHHVRPRDKPVSASWGYNQGPPFNLPRL